MKQIFKIAGAGAVVLLLLSCATADPRNKYPDMVADMDPFAVGAIEAAFDRMFSSNLAKADIEVIFYPRYNTVALSFRYQAVRYRQFWDAADRKLFADALDSYKIDYAERNLINKYRKTRSIYGKTKGQLEWETFKFSKTHLSYPSIEFGYRIRGDKPYFATLTRSAQEEPGSGDNSTLVDNSQINMYFTRAQAEELANIFEQSFLMEMLTAPRAADEENAEEQSPSRKSREPASSNIQYDED